MYEHFNLKERGKHPRSVSEYWIAKAEGAPKTLWAKYDVEITRTAS